MFNAEMNRLTRLFAKKRKPLFEGLKDFSGDQFSKGKAVFVTGVGRSGTHFIARLFSGSSEVNSFHMDDIGDAVGDSFTWYCKWHRLPVSHDGFIRSRSLLIEKSFRQSSMFLESNPMIAFLIDELSKFDSRFLIMVRNPKSVVESHYRKGWYEEVHSPESDLVPGYEYFHLKPNHFFSRIQPIDSTERKDWSDMTRIGKISWMWQKTYERIFEQLKTLPENRYRIVLLDTFRYEHYIGLNDFLGLSDKRSEKDFLRIMKARPGRGQSSYPVLWNEQAKKEFNFHIGKAANLFNFPNDSAKWLFE